MDNPCPSCGGGQNETSGSGRRCYGYTHDHERGYFCSQVPSDQYDEGSGCWFHAKVENGVVAKAVAREVVKTTIAEFAKEKGLRKETLLDLHCKNVRHGFIVGTKVRHKDPKYTHLKGYSATTNPLFPMPGDELPQHIYLVPSETDAFTLREIELDAFAITGGEHEKGFLKHGHYRDLRRRGVARVTICGHGDDKGQAWMWSEVGTARSVGLEVAVIKLAPLYDHFGAGLKDLNELWLDCDLDPEEFLSEIRERTEEIESRPFAVAGSEFIEKAEEEVDWLVPDFIARLDKVGLNAPAKTLKTYEMLAFVLAASQALPVFKNQAWTPKHPLCALIIEEEGNEIQFAKRMRRIARGLHLDPHEIDLPHVKHRTGFKLDVPQVDLLIEYVLAHEIDLVVFDPWVRVLPTGTNENLGGTDGQGRAWEQIARLATDAGAASFILHHQGHAGRFDAITGGRGWSGFGGEIDVGLALAHHETDEDEAGWKYLALDIQGREIESEAGPTNASLLRYRFDKDEDLFESEFAPGTVPKTPKINVRKVSKVKPVVEAYVHNNGGAVVLTKDVHEEVNRLLHESVTRQAVIDQLEALESEGQVVGHPNAGAHGAKGWSWASA